MKRWTIVVAIDHGATIEIGGHHENRRTPRQPFRVVLERNRAEQDLMQIHRGRVLVADGATPATAQRLLSHLAATGQLKPGVLVVL